MIQIDKNIPIGRPGATDETILIHEMIKQMEVGDSTVITTDNYGKFRSSLCRIPERIGLKMKFRGIKESDNKYRIWRVA
ncbi:MAG TPA: hypothetical protein VN922_24650 [Bacteroidia bacterium]|nr:hypothetical protein [Bacteroidia bacterium]